MRGPFVHQTGSYTSIKDAILSEAQSYSDSVSVRVLISAQMLHPPCLSSSFIPLKLLLAEQESQCHTTTKSLRASENRWKKIAYVEVEV